MSHLGRVDYVLSQCTLRDEGRFAFGTIAITAANGDTLWLSESGTFTIPVLVDPPPFADLAISWNATGGTGRFQDATGSGFAIGRTDIPGGFTELELAGSIRYDASNRAGR